MDRLMDSLELKHLLQENKRLNEQMRLLPAILENAPILISAKDLNGNILLTNTRFSILEGPEPNAYLHRNVYDLFPKEIADELWKDDKKLKNRLHQFRLKSMFTIRMAAYTPTTLPNSACWTTTTPLSEPAPFPSISPTANNWKKTFIAII